MVREIKGNIQTQTIISKPRKQLGGRGRLWFWRAEVRYDDNEELYWSSGQFLYCSALSHCSLHCRLLYLLLLAAGSFLMAAMLTPSLQHQLQSAFKGQSPPPLTNLQSQIVNHLRLLISIFLYIIMSSRFTLLDNFTLYLTPSPWFSV